MKIFDFTSLLDLLMDDKEAAKTILQEYKAQAETHFCIIKDTVSRLCGGEEDAALRETLQKEAHLIKGSSLNITAEALGSTMLEMEMGSNTKSAQELSVLLNKAEDDFKALCAEMAARAGASD